MLVTAGADRLTNVVLPGSLHVNLITLRAVNVVSPPVRSRSTWYDATLMSAARSLASSLVRFADKAGSPPVFRSIRPPRNQRRRRGVVAGGTAAFCFRSGSV